MVSQQQLRRIVWTGAIAAITATGAWYGAGLKITQEHKTVREKIHEATPEEKIAQLEEIRSNLVSKRMTIAKKIEEIEKRRRGATREESMAGRERRWSYSSQAPLRQDESARRGPEGLCITCGDSGHIAAICPNRR